MKQDDVYQSLQDAWIELWQLVGSPPNGTARFNHAAKSFVVGAQTVLTLLKASKIPGRANQVRKALDTLSIQQALDPWRNPQSR
jgi:hypothetical protein